jgi:hypothetical protein
LLIVGCKNYLLSLQSFFCSKKSAESATDQN